MEGLAKSMAKPTTALGKLGRTALSVGASMGTDLLIGAGIQFVASKWEEYATRQQRAVDEANQLIDEHAEKANTLSSAAQMIESSGERFIELQKGINTATGENKSLTAAEYEEYTTMANSLAQTLPGLSNGYNAVGNAKVKAVRSMSDLTSEVEKQNEALNQDTIDNAHQYVKAFNDLNDHEAVTVKGDVAGYKQQERTLKKLLDAKDDLESLEFTPDQYGNTPTSLLGTIGKFKMIAHPERYVDQLSQLDKNTLKQISDEIGVDAFNIFGQLDRKALQDNIGLYEEYFDNIDKKAQESFDTYNKPVLDAYAQNSKNFDSLSDTTQEIMSSYINSLDSTDENLELFTGDTIDESVDKMKNWSQTLTRDLKKEGVQEALSDLVNLNPDDMTLQDYKNQVGDLTDFISDRVSGMSKDNLENMIGYEDMLDQMEADYTNAYDAIGKEASKLTTKQLSDLNILMSDKPTLEIDSYADAINALNDYYEAQAATLENMQTTFSNAVTGQANINQALQNSASATGLLTDDLTNLASAFSTVEGYNTDELLEKTAGGLRLNRDALSAYQAEQEKNVKEDFANALEQQNKALDEQQRILASNKATQAQKDQAQSEIENIKSQIDQLELLQSQYNGLTSDYSKWMNALSNGEEGDIYDTVATNWQSAKKAAEEGWIGTDEFKSAVDYMYSGSLDNQTPQEVKAVFDELNGLVSGWYQFDDDGNLLGQQSLKQFVSDAKTLGDVLGHDVETSFEKLDDGTYKATLNAQEFADAWGVSEEVITDLAGKMRDAGWDVEVEGITQSAEEVIQSAEEAQGVLNRMTEQTYEFDFDTTSLEKAQEQIQKAKEQLDQFRNEDGSYNMEAPGASEAAQVYESTVRREQELSKPSISMIDTSSVAESTRDWVEAAQNFQTAKDEMDVQTQLAQQELPNTLEQATQAAQEAFKTFQGINKDNNLFDVDTSDLQSAEDDLAKLGSEEIEAKVGADTSKAESDIHGLEDSSITINADVSTSGGAEELTNTFASIPEGVATTVTVDVEGEDQVENLTSAMESAPDNTPVTISCNVENAEQLETITQKASELNETGKNIKIDATVGDVDTSSIESSGEEVEIPVTVKLDESQFSALTQGLSGDPVEIPTEVEPPEVPEIPEGETVQYPSEVEQPTPPDVEGDTVEYPSTVETPEPPDVEGDTVDYQSTVEPPETPEVPEGGTVNYDSKVEQPEVPSPPDGGTVNYGSKVDEPNPPAPPDGGDVHYGSTVDTPVAPAPPAGGTVHYSSIVDQPTVTDEQATVNYTVNDPPPPNYPDQNPSVNYHLNAPAPPSYPNISRTITYTIQTIGSVPGKASGTMLSPSAFPARASGTAYNAINYKNAYAGGKVALPKDETALVNELGTESIIRNGQWMLIPGGMHMQSLKKGDIILSAQQTADLLRSGRASGHGKAYADGTIKDVRAIMSSMKAYASGTGFVVSHAYADGSDSEVKSKWENVIDWIEKAVEKLAYNIDLFTARAESWASYQSQNHSINSAMKETQKLIDTYEKSIDYYKSKEAEIGLSPELQEKVIHGTIEMTEYDEATRQQIEDFEEMRDKIREAEKEVLELNKQLKELAQQKLDNITEKFEAIRGVTISNIDVIDAKLDFWDASGYTYTNSPTYQQLLSDKSAQIEKNISQLEKERSAYAKELKKAAKTFGKNSKEYYEAEAELNKIIEELYSARADLAENEQFRMYGTKQNIRQYAINKEERALERLQRSMDIRQAQNKNLTKNDYKERIDTLNAAYAEYEKMIQLYKDEMVTLAVNSERYQELAEKIEEAQQAQADFVLDMEDCADKMRELDWKPFNDAIDSYNKAIEGVEHLRSLINKNNLVAIDASITSDGYSELMLIAKAMEINKQKVADYKEGIANINEELENGRISEEEYKEYLDEYTKGIYDATEANEDYKDAIMDVYKAQLEAENDLLQDNIEKRQEALDAKREYYEWDRNLRDKNKDIISLQAQIAALEGTSNAAGQAKLAQLRAELAEKQQDLDDDITDRTFDKISDGLDDLSDDANNVLDSSLDALERNAQYQEAVIKNMLNKTVSMYESAYGHINNIIAQTGTYIENTLKDQLIGIGGILGQDQFGQTAGNAQKPTLDPSDSATGVNTNKDPTVSPGNSGSVNDMVNTDTKGEAEGDLINNVKKITVSPSKKTITVGSTVQLKANITAEKGGKPQTSAVSWTSSNPSVATVNSKGLVKGIHYGYATITCKSADANWDKKSGTCEITVITKTEGILAANKGQTNNGTSTLNQWFGALGYGQLSREEAATIAKEHGLNYDADELMVKGSAKKDQAIIDAMKGPMLKKVIKAMKDDTRSKAELEKEASALGMYIHDTYGKEMTASDAMKIATILQVDVPSKFSEWTSADRNAVKKELMKYKISFKKGGYVGNKNYIPLAKIGDEEFVRYLAQKGDSGITGINPGEVILTKEKADALLNTIMPVSEALADSIQQASNYSSVINKQPIQNINTTYGSLLTVNGDVNRDTLPGLQAILEKSYKYTSEQLKREMRKNGTK